MKIQVKNKQLFAWLLQLYSKHIKMKTIIIIAFVFCIALVGCSVTQPEERGYYPPQQSGVYYSPSPYYNTYDPYSYDPYYRPYAYGNTYPVYQGRTYRRDYERPQQYPVRTYRNDRRNDGDRDDRREVRQQPTQNQNNVQQQERRLPDGSRVSPDGAITLPNGRVIEKRNQ